MTISELERQLKALREKHGDLPVIVDGISHRFPPDLEVRGTGTARHLVLNS